jgi:hypothetical protein
MNRLDPVLVKTLLSALGLASTLMLTPGSPTVAADSPPHVLLLNSAALVRAQAAARGGDPSLQAQLATLRQRADAALARPRLTVTAKQVPPPSGDVHDYVSLSIYWWPDPAGAAGTPYIQRDGVRNPEADDTARYDANPLSRTVGDVELLSLAYYLGGDERYARHAVQLLRTWFIDPETRMNPNFRYAQIIPGRDAVRGTGIIESRRFTRIVDSVALLDGCACWSGADQQGLRAWFHEFQTWLRTSPNGLMEARTTNNHAVWYDVQLADFALFGGDVEVARQVLGAAPTARIDTQIAADGSMPRELERTRAFHYSNFNLQAFAELATLGQFVDVDLWSYTSATNGASIRQALDFLIPYITAAETWPYDEITDVDAYQETAQILTRAAQAYPDGAYTEVLDQLSAGHFADDALRLRLGYWPD